MTERSNKEIIKGMREIVKPFIGNSLKRENYEGMGDIDKAEFETEFEKVLTLAEKAEKLPEILDKISAEIKDMEYHMIDCEVLVSQEEVLDIIEKYKGGE